MHRIFNISFLTVVIAGCVHPCMGQKTPDSSTPAAHITQPLLFIRMNAPVDGPGERFAPDPRAPVLLNGLFDHEYAKATSRREWFTPDPYDPGPKREAFVGGFFNYARSAGPVPAVPTTLPLLMITGLTVSRRMRR